MLVWTELFLQHLLWRQRIQRNRNELHQRGNTLLTSNCGSLLPLRVAKFPGSGSFKSMNDIKSPVHATGSWARRPQVTGTGDRPSNSVALRTGGLCTPPSALLCQKSASDADMPADRTLHRITVVQQTLLSRVTHNNVQIRTRDRPRGRPGREVQFQVSNPRVTT